MDLLEWVFQKISDRNLQSRQIEKSIYEIVTENEVLLLKTLLNYILAGEAPPVLVGKGLGRVGGDSIFLPEQINLFKNSELNRKILIHKILVCGVIYKNKIAYSKSNLTYAERTLEIYNIRERIVNYLTAIFPKFPDLHSELQLHLAGLKKSTKVEDLGFIELVSTCEPKSFSRWQKFPEQSLALWVEPLEYKYTNSNAIELLDKFDQEKLHQGTEVEGNSSTEAVEVVSLEKKKEQQNPVFHAFEKLEAADEYNGGSRVSDAVDEIEDHQQALSELNLKHVTREGGGAGSIYRGHFSELFGGNLIKEPAPRYAVYKKTAEWNFRTKELVADHCRLYLLNENVLKNESSDVINANAETLKHNFSESLQNNYSTEIEHWKNKIWSLVNQRKWKDRQINGTDWSLDSFTRYCADILASGQGDSRLYIQNFRQERDYHVSILMDLSLSTESWVQNRKVLDIQLESIGLCGLLLKELNEPISISTTWSETRHHCYMQKIKNFNSSWDNFFEQAEKIVPRGYTRLGPAIRFASEELVSSSSKKKLLILLTDGKPTDLDQYEGRYGIEDMRHALVEAEQQGVHIQALAIDKEAKFYFPQIFSKNNYQILSDPKLLPEQLFKIYFNFTHQ